MGGRQRKKLVGGVKDNHRKRQKLGDAKKNNGQKRQKVVEPKNNNDRKQAESGQIGQITTHIPKPAIKARLVELFEYAPFAKQHTGRRLPETTSRQGKTREEQKSAKPCLKPFDALETLECVVDSCVIQSLMRYYRNAACWNEEIAECAQRDDCNSTEVRRIHSVLSNPSTTLTQYMMDWGYAVGEMQDYEEVISNSLVNIGRSTENKTDDSNNQLGLKFNVRLRHYVQVIW